MRRKLLVNAGPAWTRAALIEDGRFAEIRLLPARGEESAWPLRVGDIYMGRIRTVSEPMAAAFVDLGAGPDGIAPLPVDGGRLAEGQAVLVQATGPAFQDKGPRLSLTPHLQGRFAALRPGAGDGLPKAASDSERAALEGLARRADVPHGARLILRMRAAAADSDLVIADIAELAARWGAMQNAAASAAPPVRLTPPWDAAVEAVASFARYDMNEIVFDDAAAFLAAKAAYSASAPDLVECMTLYTDQKPLFQTNDVEAAFEAALSPNVDLPAGGRLVISETPALVAVDIDAGSGVATGDKAKTALAVNEAAAERIAREVRLRALGGQVAVDFLPLERPADQARLLHALETAFVAQGLSPRIGPMASFGVVALAVKRLRLSLLEEMTEDGADAPAPGRRFSLERRVAIALAKLDDALRAAPSAKVRLTAPKDVADAIEGAPRRLKGLAARRGARFEIHADKTLKGEAAHVDIRAV